MGTHLLKTVVWWLDSVACLLREVENLLSAVQDR